ncbi:hypothetical protein [Clostridium pasteurianum]|uniref:Uncharacterized protein n=1 Tax=Clostridium pasteurianum BC1 TaxID=86416 RepID=R4K794_CLOPA|nr:hypothetical protein [Clostridium pasteurianum]AGK99032.1 hypothetical protein Clopa_4313 [Clostridium pasteurianum BC1]
MAKYKIYIDETRTLRHTVILETEEDIDKTLDQAQIGDCVHLYDVISALEDEGCNVNEVAEDDNGDSEFDVDEYEEIDESEGNVDGKKS